MAADGQRAPLAALIDSVKVEPGGLMVRVHAHALDSRHGPIPCWSFVSEGLWPHGQKEVVFTVQRRPGEAETAYPRDLLRFYAVLAELSLARRFVDVGGFTSIEPPGHLLGRSDFRCVLYTPPQAISGMRICAPSLTALVLTESELSLSREFGMVRLMSTLGDRHRYFPTAPWADRDREAVLDPAGMSQSLLARAPRVELWSSSVRQTGMVAATTARRGPDGLPGQMVTYGPTRVEFRLRPAARRVMQQIVPKIRPGMPVAFLVGPEPLPHSCLTWAPGQQGMRGIMSPDGPGSIAAGNFIMFIAGQDHDGAQVVEDGFAMFLRAPTWARIQQALASGEPISVDATSPDRSGLEIVWLPELEPEFVDTADLHASGGWNRFVTTPIQNGDDDSGPIRVELIALLTVLPVMSNRASGEDLGNYANALGVVAVPHLAAATTGIGQDLFIECEVRPGGGRTFRCGVRPLSAGDPSVGLSDRLMEVKPPPVCGGPVRIQLNLTLWGGSSEDGRAEVPDGN